MVDITDASARHRQSPPDTPSSKTCVADTTKSAPAPTHPCPRPRRVRPSRDGRLHHFPATPRCPPRSINATEPGVATAGPFAWHSRRSAGPCHQHRPRPTPLRPPAAAPGRWIRAKSTSKVHSESRARRGARAHAHRPTEPSHINSRRVIGGMCWIGCASASGDSIKSAGARPRIQSALQRIASISSAPMPRSEMIVVRAGRGSAK